MNPIKTRPPGQAPWSLALAFVLPCVLLLVGCTARRQPITIATPTPRVTLTADRTAIEVDGVDARLLAALAKAPEQALAVFSVYANKQESDAPGDSQPIVGSYRVDAARSVLRFDPRFPLQPGVPYLAVFQPPSGVGARGAILIPKPATMPTFVEQIYPTANVLPENQLKFYIHFSAPMSRGEAYEHIKLLDSNGKAIESVFLELGEELWDPAGKRFTLLFDPGRIKHGLKPREDLGPTLENGKTYTLVIDKQWSDAYGNPLQQEFRKSIKAGPPVEKAVDPQAWKLEPPAGATEPLTVTFPVPMEHALLHRELWVTDVDGKRVAGKLVVSDEEKRWQFTPSAAWKPGPYKLVAKATLEDLAGNRIGRLFEVDVFQKVDREITAATVELPFEVK